MEHFLSQAHLPFQLKDYLELVDWTGRAIRHDKIGSIPQHLDHLFERLKVQPVGWLPIVTQFHGQVTRVAGNPSQLQQLAEHWGQKWIKGKKAQSGFYRKIA